LTDHTSKSGATDTHIQTNGPKLVQTQAYALGNNDDNFQLHRFTTGKNIAKSFCGQFFYSHYTAKHAAACGHQAAEGKGAQQVDRKNTKILGENHEKPAQRPLSFHLH